MGDSFFAIVVYSFRHGLRCLVGAIWPTLVSDPADFRTGLLETGEVGCWWSYLLGGCNPAPTRISCGRSRIRREEEAWALVFRGCYDPAYALGDTML